MVTSTRTAPAECDICGHAIETVFIDGSTKIGPWADMCPSCHAKIGNGLGTGKGQKYELKDGKFVKVA